MPAFNIARPEAPSAASTTIHGRKTREGAPSAKEETKMIIYGTAILAACHLLGVYMGDLLGSLIGVKANVGGVGIAMMLLITARVYLHRRGLMPASTEGGVGFWAAMYIPVVVAMAAQQNVVAALKGGPVAVVAALGAVLLCASVIALINRSASQSTDTRWQNATAADKP
jgi:malonate transporter MadL subunit